MNKYSIVSREFCQIPVTKDGRPEWVINHHLLTKITVKTNDGLRKSICQCPRLKVVATAFQAVTTNQ